MLAIFFAQRVILGKADFSVEYGDSKYIPEPLREQVAENLITSGLGYLVPKEFGGTAG